MLILYCLFIYVIGGLSASVTYHRLLTHRSFEAVPWFERVLVILALPAGTPIQWVGTHRQHHRYTDREGDPHSPHVYGFWYAHCGWYIQQKNPILCLFYALGGPFRMLFDGFWRPQTNQEYNHLAKDIAEKPFFKTVSQPLPYAIIMSFYCAAILLPTYYFWQLKGIFAVWLVLVLVYNIGDSVNSVGHLVGEKINNNNQSRNNLFLAIFGFGEGWHAQHHAQPNQPHLKYDLGFLFIQVFKFLGLIKKINQ
jgi:fatty-acid desaturase